MPKDENNQRERNLAKLRKRLKRHDALISSSERRIERRRKNISFLDSLVKEKKITEKKIIESKNYSRKEIEKSSGIIKSEREKLKEIKEKIKGLENEIKRGRVEKIKKQNKNNKMAQIEIERQRQIQLKKTNGRVKRDDRIISKSKESVFNRSRSPRSKRIEKIRQNRNKDYRSPIRSYHSQFKDNIIIPESLNPISLSSVKKKNIENFEESFCFILNRSWEYKILTNRGWINKFKRANRLISIASNNRIEFNRADNCDIYIDIDDILTDYANTEYGNEILEEDKNKIKEICQKFLSDNTQYIFSSLKWKKSKNLEEVI